MDVMALTMIYAAAAFVVWYTVTAAVSFSHGFFKNYGDHSVFTNYLAYLELVVVALFIGWSFVMAVTGTVGAAEVWTALDTRLAEAEESSIGIETPLDWDKSIKANSLLMVAAITVCISALSLANITDNLTDYFNEYDKVEQNEYSNEDEGTAAEHDLLYHLILSIYGWFTLSAISLGGLIFTFVNFKFDDEFTCDLEESGYTFENHYNALVAIRQSMTDRADCKKKMPSLFKIVDINGDGYVSRCEDATLQFAMGATPEYALKFSGQFNLGAWKNICNEEFRE